MMPMLIVDDIGSDGIPCNNAAFSEVTMLRVYRCRRWWRLYCQSSIKEMMNFAYSKTLRYRRRLDTKHG